jgi:hypothetical protein
MLEELQSLSETKKKQVLIIATIIIMVIVVGVWATYFNGIIQGSSQAAVAAPATSTVAVVATTPVAVAVPTAQASGPSLWQNIKNGFGSIADIFKKPSQYTVRPQSN